MVRIAAALVFALAADAASAGIFKCKVASGSTRTSDRPMSGCTEQVELNDDGSFKRVVPPMQTDEERAVAEAKERQAAVERTEEAVRQRRDQNLVTRFPIQARHDVARKEALDAVDSSIRISEGRIEKLKLERKPLDDEAMFYLGKPLPFKLKLQIDANDAAKQAQEALIVNQRAEKERIDKLFDEELAKLRVLWAKQRKP